MKRLGPMTIGTLFVAVVASLGWCACTGSNARSTIAAEEHFNAQWAQDARWEQGTAEVAKYQAERTVYNKVRNFEYTFILVKETFNREFDTKTDDYDRDDLFDVMKVNKFARIPTDNYPYHYMTSLFFRRAQPAVVHKLTNTSQEWCGTTSKYFLNQGASYEFGYNSYWDGQGIGQTTVDGNIMFEDQLSYSLRTLSFAEGLSFKQRVAESQITSKATIPTIYDATFTVNQVNDFALDTDYPLEKAPVWKVRVQLDAQKTNEYWFDSQYPNVLLKQATWDGRQLQLKEVYMDDYWVIG